MCFNNDKRVKETKKSVCILRMIYKFIKLVIEELEGQNKYMYKKYMFYTYTSIFLCVLGMI